MSRNMLSSHVFTETFKLNVVEPGGCSGFTACFQVPSVHKDIGDTANGYFPTFKGHVLLEVPFDDHSGS